MSSSFATLGHAAAAGDKIQLRIHAAVLLDGFDRLSRNRFEFFTCALAITAPQRSRQAYAPNAISQAYGSTCTRAETAFRRETMIAFADHAGANFVAGELYHMHGSGLACILSAGSPSR